MRTLILLATVLLAGCAYNAHRADAETAYYQAQAQQQRPPIFEIEAQPGEKIVLAGVARMAVYSPEATTANVHQYRAEANPWVSIFGEATRAALGFSGVYYGARVLDTAITNAGGNQSTVTTVGGNYGDTRRDTVGGNLGDTAGGDMIGGDRIDDRSVGRDYIGRDNRVGDDISDSCIGDDCRNDSMGPWRDDHSDNSDRSDNRRPAPPAPPAP